MLAFTLALLLLVAYFHIEILWKLIGVFFAVFLFGMMTSLVIGTYQAVRVQVGDNWVPRGFMDKLKFWKRKKSINKGIKISTIA